MRRKPNVLVLLAALLLLSGGIIPSSIFAQEAPRSYGDIGLGMTLDEAKEALRTDATIDYRGDPDVTLVPITEQPMIQADGFRFVDQIVLQFHQDALYIIRVELSPTEFDYFSVYRSLVDRYGEPNSLSPDGAFWENEVTLFSLEKPLTVKYIDRETFSAIVDGGEAAESVRQITRERFLERL